MMVYLLPVLIYDGFGTTKPSVHNRVVRPLEVGGLIVTDDLALPDPSSLISGVDIEANIILDKTMDVCDQVRHFTSWALEGDWPRWLTFPAWEKWAGEESRNEKNVKARTKELTLYSEHQAFYHRSPHRMHRKSKLVSDSSWTWAFDNRKKQKESEVREQEGVIILDHKSQLKGRHTITLKKDNESH